jgi:hypothetical protein
MLAFALFILIIYGATAESTHTHGIASSRSSIVSQTSLGNSSNDQSRLKSSLSINDCLICQLHQQLSSTLFTALPHVAAPPAQFLAATTTPSFHLPLFVALQRERGPPTASLS